MLENSSAVTEEEINKQKSLNLFDVKFFDIFDKYRDLHYTAELNFAKLSFFPKFQFHTRKILQ